MRRKISEEEISARQTAAGGWTKGQLAQWGVPWPAPNGWKKAILQHGIPYCEVIEIFAGGTILAKDKPLFCPHCDSELIAEYHRLWNAHAAMDDLVAVLEQRRGKIVEAIWPNGSRQWQCGYCGRAVLVKKQKARR